MADAGGRAAGVNRGGPQDGMSRGVPGHYVLRGYETTGDDDGGRAARVSRGGSPPDGVSKEGSRPLCVPKLEVTNAGGLAGGVRA